jgi:hypothetical protein
MSSKSASPRFERSTVIVQSMQATPPQEMSASWP